MRNSLKLIAFGAARAALYPLTSHTPRFSEDRKPFGRLQQIDTNLAARQRYTRFERAVEDVGRDDICIDLGANVGDVTARLARTGARVIAVEPDPWTFARLQERVEGLENISLIQAAAGVEEGEVRLFRHAGFEFDPAAKSLGSTVVKSKIDIDSSASMPVKQIDFPALLEALGRKVKILKMDIEGAEVDILETMLDRGLMERIDYLFAETHERLVPSTATRVAKIRHRVKSLRGANRIDLDWW